MPLNRLVLPGFVGLCALVVLQNAWLHEDAFITFRSVDNFINGHGPTWNIGERVQTFTHPLWFFALSTAYALTGEIFYTGIFLAWAVSLAAGLVMALRLAPAPGHAGLGIALLCSSKAFVDYSTSGLENPLSHLLLALFTALYFHWQPTLRALTLLALVAGLATFNRMDTLLLYLPALGVGVWRLQTPRALGAVAIGFAPFIIWELFSLCYYGFLFPNTAYGKLGTGIPATDLAQQGIYYLYNSLQVDPPTLVVIAAGAAGICYASKRPQLPLVAGLLLYLVYIVKVGGDYMSGRLLSTPFFGAVLLIVYNLRIPTRKRLYFTLVAILAVGLAMPYAPLKSGLDYGQRGAPGSHHIVDERANYYAHTGLLPALMADIAYPRHEWVDLGRTMAEKSRASEGVVTTFINLGILGYYAGPLAHHLDVLGIADPLLARLPAFADPDWAPGHFTRIVPEGYIATQLYGYNLIADQNLAAYYDKLRIVIGGPLFSGDRWAKIWQLNTGHYDQLIDYDAYRHPTAEQRARSQAQLSPPIRPRPDALTRAIEAGNIFFARRQFARAATAYQQAIDLRPNQPSSHHNLAAVFLATGDTRQARATFQKAAELGSQIAETYRALIWLAQKAGDGDGAQRAYRLAAQHLPTSAMTALSEYLKANP